MPRNARPGDTLRVFVYTDSEDRPVATTLKPKAVEGEVQPLLTAQEIEDLVAYLMTLKDM